MNAKVHYSYYISVFTVFDKILDIIYSIIIGCIMLQTFLPTFFFYLNFLLYLCLFCFCLLMQKVSLVNEDYHCAAVNHKERTAKSNLLNHPTLYKFAGSWRNSQGCLLCILFSSLAFCVIWLVQSWVKGRSDFNKDSSKIYFWTSQLTIRYNWFCLRAETRWPFQTFSIITF